MRVLKSWPFFKENLFKNWLFLAYAVDKAEEDEYKNRIRKSFGWDKDTEIEFTGGVNLSKAIKI